MHGLNYVEAMQWIFEAQNASSGLNQKCIAAKGEEEGYQCMFAQHTAPFIESKFMAIQSRFDKWQIERILLGDSIYSDDKRQINAYGQQLEDSMIQYLLESKNEDTGKRMLYLDSCMHHGYGMAWDDIEIGGGNVIGGLHANQIQYHFWFNDIPHHDRFIQHREYPCDECCHGTVE